MNTNPIKNPPIFEIIIDCGLADIIQDIEISKESVLSLINDYEDKEWRYEKFQKFIWNNIAETALSKQEQESMIGEPASALIEAAKNLRLTDSSKDNSEGSELAEILLYGILKHYFRALPVVPKIFYKQNANDFAKGVDSVHIVLNEEQTDFTIWFGEAKFYEKIDDAHLSRVITSIQQSLKADKIKKEKRIITGIHDFDYYIEKQELKEKLITFLSDLTSLDLLRPKLHIPILLLYECEITAKFDERTDDFIKEIVSYHKEKAIRYFRKQIDILSGLPKYNEIYFHLIVFPVPNKHKIVERFIKQAKVLKGE